MGKDAVREFFETVAESSDMAEEYSSVVRGAVVELASRHGFHFTVEELADTLGSEGGELSDTDLDDVAGGYQQPANIKQPRLGKFSSTGGLTVPNPSVFVVEEESPQP